MTAFMYYMRRIKMLEEFIYVTSDTLGAKPYFTVYAVQELMNDITKAHKEQYLTQYQTKKLIDKIREDLYG